MKTLALCLLVLVCVAELISFIWAEEIEASKEIAGKLVVREDKSSLIQKRSFKKDFNNPLFIVQKYDRNFIMNKL